MCAITTCIILAALGSPLSAADALKFQPLILHDVSTPSPSDPLQTLVWAKEIAAQNEYVTRELKKPLNGKNARLNTIATTYRDGGDILIVSIISSRDCIGGSNNFNSGIEASDCPLRIVRLRNGKPVGIDTARACYIDTDNVPRENANDSTSALYDPSSGTLQFKTVVAGAPVPECTKTVTLTR